MKIHDDGSVTFTSGEMLVIVCGVQGLRNPISEVDVMGAEMLVSLPKHLRVAGYAKHLVRVFNAVKDGVTPDVGVFSDNARNDAN